jgi:hypothetical protein
MKSYQSKNNSKRSRFVIRQRVKLSRRKIALMTTGALLVIVAAVVIFINVTDERRTFAASNGDYRTKASGNWNAIGTWETYNGSAWVAASVTPTSNDAIITIQSGNTVTVTANVTADQVIINSGGEVDVNSGVTLTVANGTGTDLDVSGIFKSTGTVTINASATIAFESGGKYQHAFTTTAGTIPTATWNSGSTCEIIGYTSNTNAPAGLQTFSNFTWNCPSQTGIVNLNNGLSTINGDFILNSTGSGELDISDVSNFNFTVNGNYAQTGGTVSYNIANGKKTNIYIGGNWSHTGGTIQVGGNSGTSSEFFFNKSGIQTFTASGNTIGNYIDFNVSSGSILSMGTNVLTGRKFTLSAGGGLMLGSPAGITSSGATGNVQTTTTRSFDINGDYTYNGLSAQSTGNGLPSTIHNLTINNSSGVTLTSATAVTNILTLTSGIVATGSNELQVTNTLTTSITGQSSLSYVAGNLRRNVSGNGSYDFPVGTISNYELATVNLLSVTGFTNILGTFTNSNPVSPGYPLIGIIVNGTDITSMLNYGYWTFTPNLPITGGAYNITLNERGHTNSAPDPHAYCLLSRNNPTSSWQFRGTHSNSTQSETGGTAIAASSGVNSSGGDFGIGMGWGPLPIELIYFNAQLKAGHVDLSWATASEINNDVFTVERSSDGIHFTMLLRKQGAGNSTITRYYNDVDNKPLTGISYYRLKQTDYDGHCTYSGIKTVNYNQSDDLDESILKIVSVAPNPFNETFSLSFKMKISCIVEIQLYSSSGQMIFTDKINSIEGINTYNFTDKQGLKRGIYFLNVLCNDQKQVQKIIKN